MKLGLLCAEGQTQDFRCPHVVGGYGLILTKREFSAGSLHSD